MTDYVKNLYTHFVIVFVILFLSSNFFVDPRSWWSLYNVEILDKSSSIINFSWVKIVIYALITLIFVAFLNQQSVKKIVKTMLKIGFMKFQILYKKTINIGLK
jgi:hypothetical protein